MSLCTDYLPSNFSLPNSISYYYAATSTTTTQYPHECDIGFSSVFVPSSILSISTGIASTNCPSMTVTVTVIVGGIVIVGGNGNGIGTVCGCLGRMAIIRIRVGMFCLLIFFLGVEYPALTCLNSFEVISFICSLMLIWMPLGLLVCSSDSSILCM